MTERSLEWFLLILRTVLSGKDILEEDFFQTSPTLGRGKEALNDDDDGDDGDMYTLEQLQMSQSKSKSPTRDHLSKISINLPSLYFIIYWKSGEVGL